MSTKQLVDNIYKMSNDQIIGLAKNHFMPSDVQLAIAKYPYPRSHMYLAENPGLTKETRDYLWSDRCNRGYTLKTVMMAMGHYADEPGKYYELYEKYPSAWNRSPWRMSNAFFGNYWHPRTESSTPADLLNRIYDEVFASKTQASRKFGYYEAPRYSLERMAKCKNVDLKLAIKLSHSEWEVVRKLGFEKIVELS